MHPPARIAFATVRPTRTCPHLPAPPLSCALLWLVAGVFHALERDPWKRLVGRSAPAFDPELCHSGCTPPKHLEWQSVNFAASLVGYGTERDGRGGRLDYWIVQMPFGSAFGEDGFVRIQRGEASIEAAAVVVEPMV